jgi:hypothetical protein
MKQKKKIPFRNRNQTGWWIASYLERFEYYDEDKRNPNRKCLAWENTILIRAKNRDIAFKKAVAIGREGSEAWDEGTGRKGIWRFEGLTNLLPVYDKIENGSEVLWTEHRGRTVKKIKSFVKTKKDLSVFDDTLNERESSNAG